MDIPTRQIHYVSFRYFLKEEFLSRCRRNPSYSLRAFAKALGINSGSLAQILSGKRKITAQAYQSLAKRLRLSNRQRRWFEKSIEKTYDSVNAVENPAYLHSILQHKKLIQWQCIALLELAKTADFEPDLAWIAERLNISHARAKCTLDVLIRSGLIKVDSSGEWIVSEKNLVALPAIPDEFIKAEVQKTLRHSAKIYPGMPFRKGICHSVIFAVAQKDVSDLIGQLVSRDIQLVEGADEGGPYDEVYCLNSLLVPLSRLKAAKNAAEPLQQKETGDLVR